MIVALPARQWAVRALVGRSTTTLRQHRRSFFTSSSSISTARNSCLGRNNRQGRLGLVALASVTAAVMNNHSSASALAYCSPEEEEEQEEEIMAAPPQVLFPAEWLQEDHYNGITLHLQDDDSQKDLDAAQFQSMLTSSLAAWRQQGRKGIWLHLSHAHADKVPIAVQAGFSFHMVTSFQQTNNNGAADNAASSSSAGGGCLVLSQWLPTDTPSKLPAGPSHQVGVGCLVFHPYSNNKQMLVVKEQTGPAAAADLWKMPTGLLDRNEDIHEAAIRELREETGLEANFVELLQLRQAHATAKSGRSVSDLFCVCVLELTSQSAAVLQGQFDQLCPDEIAAAQWMDVADYCAQERWQTSPVYMELNRIIMETAHNNNSRATTAGTQSSSSGLQHQTLELGFGRGTNTLYHGSTTTAKQQLYPKTSSL